MSDRDPIRGNLELKADLAGLLRLPVEEVAAMTIAEMLDHTARMSFGVLGRHVAAKHGRILADHGPDEVAERVTAALTKSHTATTPLCPASIDSKADLYSYGTAPIWFVTFGADDKVDGHLLLLSEVAEALNVPLTRADAWARAEFAHALRAQREQDAERGDGKLGRVRDLVDLEVGDWLIGTGRVLGLVLISPWSREFRAAAARASHRHGTSTGEA